MRSSRSLARRHTSSPNNIGNGMAFPSSSFSSSSSLPGTEFSTCQAKRRCPTSAARSVNSSSMGISVTVNPISRHPCASTMLSSQTDVGICTGFIAVKEQTISWRANPRKKYRACGLATSPDWTNCCTTDAQQVINEAIASFRSS